MKGWTLESLKAAGVPFTQTGGAGVAEAAPAPRQRASKPKLEAPRNRPVASEIVLDLPVPPSVNKCWANVNGVGRVRSPEYRRWHKQAVAEAKLESGARVPGAYTILIQLGELPRGSDVGNRTKPTVDMLAGLVTDDDVNCVRETAEWAPGVVAKGRMRVTITKAEASHV